MPSTDAGGLPRRKPQASRDDNPTPAERADFVVRKLEQFIRDGRTAGEGVSLRRWQDLARAEIANAIAEADLDRRASTGATQRLLFALGAAFTTLGFWGVLWAYDQVHYFVSALICGLAGVVALAVSAEWQVRRLFRRRAVAKRADSVRRIESLTRRLARMEREIKERAEAMEKTLEKTGPE